MKLCNQISKARASGFKQKYFKGFPYISIHKTRSLKSISLSIQEKKRKIDFQDGHHRRHLGFPIRKILTIFDL